jgi:hypothetical protein
MSAILLSLPKIDHAVHRAADRMLPRLFVGVSVVLFHVFGLIYVQAVEADQVLGNAVTAAQSQQCQPALTHRRALA